jgi:hypothetical protein
MIGETPVRRLLSNHSGSGTRPACSWVQWLICLGIVFVGLFNALPHMREAGLAGRGGDAGVPRRKGMLHPFVHYGTPNNHIAFSSMLAGWRQLLPAGNDAVLLRLLPLGLFLAAIPATFMAARRMGGPLCAALSTALFAGSAVAGNFATQLRGYGPSWLVRGARLVVRAECVRAAAAMGLAPTGYVLASAGPRSADAADQCVLHRGGRMRCSRVPPARSRPA